MNFVSYIFFACVVVVTSGHFIPKKFVNTDTLSYELVVCQKCDGEPCDEKYLQCYHGTHTNMCGHLACLKGPGEICGGHRDQLGMCDLGLNCRCNRCSGCSLRTADCFMHTDCIKENNYKRAAGINDLMF